MIDPLSLLFLRLGISQVLSRYQNFYLNINIQKQTLSIPRTANREISPRHIKRIIFTFFGNQQPVHNGVTVSLSAFTSNAKIALLK